MEKIVITKSFLDFLHYKSDLLPLNSKIRMSVNKSRDYIEGL